MPKQRKSSPRLRGFSYAGNYAYFVTCSTCQKRPYFKDKTVIDIVLPLLKRLSTRNSFNIQAYCFMPDHLHLLLSGEDKSSLHKFMRRFKQETSFKFKKAHGTPLWHRSYYDHILRKEEALEEVALYILNNPVRKGLVEDYQKYPFSGSFIFDLKENAGTGL
jgi:putative transposase